MLEDEVPIQPPCGGAPLGIQRSGASRKKVPAVGVREPVGGLDVSTVTAARPSTSGPSSVRGDARAEDQAST